MAEQPKPARTNNDVSKKVEAKAEGAKPVAAAKPAAEPVVPAPVAKAEAPAPKPAKAEAASPKPAAKAEAAAAKPAAARRAKTSRRTAPTRRAPATPIAKSTRDAATKTRAATVTAAQTLTEGTKTMATTAEKFTADATATGKATADKMQGVFADVQGRTQSAMEKGARFYEEMGEFTKGNVEAVIASSRAAATAMESLGQDAAAYGRKSLEQATQTFKNVSSIKSPTELFQLQSDYARSAFDALVAESSRMTEKMMKLTGEVVQPLSSRFAVAADKVKTAAR